MSSKGLVIATVIAVVVRAGVAEAMPAFASPRGDRASVGSPAATRVQYYYKGHTYKRRTKQHFIRKYSGSDRS